LLPWFPGANLKEFLVTFLGEAKEEQFPLFEPKGRVWELPGASLRMVKKSFQRAKGNLGNRPRSTEAKGQRGSLLKYLIFNKIKE